MKRAFTPFLCLIAWALGVPHLIASEPAYSISPVPPWVRQVPESRLSNDESQDAEGVFWIAYDQQVKLGEPGSRESYSRVLKKILTAGGLQDETQLSFSFDPTYEKLYLHTIRIRRETEWIDVLGKANIKLLQQEEDLEASIYDGRLTALVFLEDLRVGDVLEYCYTVSGQNPVVKGRFADSFDFGFSDPVGYLRYRLLTPDIRVIYSRMHGTGGPAPVINRIGRMLEYTWERDRIPPTLSDGDLPSWFDPNPWLQVSEFGSWREVALWASDLYSVLEEQSQEVDRQAEALRKGRSRRDAILAAIRFVQDEIRYLGVETGVNSHQPHSPGQVIKQRFGDCKDKSVLLVALLAKLGVDACPVLVNTDYDRVLDTWLPSPYAFDHVIVRINEPEAVVLVDPTASLQGGTLTTMVPAVYSRILPVRKDTASLITLKEPATRGTRSVEETYEVDPKDKSAALFTVRTTYEGDQADWARASLAEKPASETGKDYLNYYAKTHRNITPKASPTITDDRTANKLIVVERYGIPDFWKTEEREYYAWAIDQALPDPETRKRTMPLAIDHPVDVRYTLRVIPNKSFRVKPGKGTVDSAAFHIVCSRKPLKNGISLEYSYRSKTAVVAANQMEKLLAALDSSEDLVYYEILPDGGGWSIGPFAFFGWALGFGAVVLAWVVAVRLMTKRPKPAAPSGWLLAEHEPRVEEAGESPMEPAAVASEKPVPPRD